MSSTKRDGNQDETVLPPSKKLRAVKKGYTVLPDGIVSADLKVLLGYCKENWNSIQFLQPPTLQDRSKRVGRRQRFDLSLNGVILYSRQNDGKRQLNTWVEKLLKNDRMDERDIDESAYDDDSTTGMEKKAAKVGRRVRNMCKELEQVAQDVTNEIEDLEVGERVRVFFNLLMIDTNATEDQLMHPDNPRGKYWTALFPLTLHENQGTTNFEKGGEPPFGKAYYFNGKVWHQGTRNASGQRRFVLMAVIMGKGAKDTNRDDAEIPILITKQTPATHAIETTGLFADYLERHLG